LQTRWAQKHNGYLLLGILSLRFLPIKRAFYELEEKTL
jgi:hypothetical protein